MLQAALELNRVHVFGEISTSQINEKINWLTEMSLAQEPFDADRGEN